MYLQNALTISNIALTDTFGKSASSIIDYEISNDQVLKMKLCWKHTDYLGTVINKLNAGITELSKPYDDLVPLTSDVPSITETSAHYTITKIGADMTVFKFAKHLCSRVGLSLRIMKAPARKKAAGFPGLVFTLSPPNPVCACSIKDKQNSYFKTNYDRIKTPQPQAHHYSYDPHNPDLALSYVP